MGKMDTFHLEQQRSHQRPQDASGQLMPKFPKYNDYSSRLESFRKWPNHFPLKEDLVKAGFFFTGDGDGCRCYECGGQLRNWDSREDPMTEHAKWYPTCLHLLFAKGQEFINGVRSRHPSDNGGLSPTNADGYTGNDDYLNQPAYLSCVEHFPKAIVDQAVRVYVSKYNNYNFGSLDLADIAYDLINGKPTLDDVHSETDRLQYDDSNHSSNVEDGATGSLHLASVEQSVQTGLSAFNVQRPTSVRVQETFYEIQ